MLNNIKSFLLSNRMKSLYWRTGMMFLAAVLSNMSMEVNGWGLTPEGTALLGLILGEISKGISNSFK